MLHQGHQLVRDDRAVLRRRPRVLRAARRAKLAQLLGGREAAERPLRVYVVEPLVLHEQLHDGLVQRRGEEETTRKRALGESAEHGAERAAAAAQQTARVRRLTHLEQATSSQDCQLCRTVEKADDNRGNI